ncbi:MAG: ABC transporter [Campylobacterales bacterium]|nr:ABC transporter [Campylobacterales bacterium]
MLKLYEKLPIEDMKGNNWIVLATSFGGVPIAKEIAKKIGAQFDFLFNEKVYMSKNNECEIAIVTETSEIVIHEELMRSFSLNLDDIYHKANFVLHTKVQEHKANYRDSLDIIDLKDRSVLLIDEGLNTGLTMMACIKSAISEGAKSISVAVPVLPSVIIKDIESIADDLFYVQALEHFVSIDFYYNTLEKVVLKQIRSIQ